MSENYKNILLIAILSFLSFDVRSQIPNIPPSVISQVQNMPVSERQQLARQYGFDISGLDSMDSSLNNDIGSKGSSPETDVIQVELKKKISESEDNQKKIRKSLREEKPIFERTYDDAKNLPVYGKFLFDPEISTYAPVDNAPVPDNYRLGVGDTLNVLLFGNENTQFELFIDRNGNVNFPKLGNFNLAGMTFEAAKTYISNRIENQMIGVQASISIGRLRSINVFMTGEAKTPGMFSVSSLSSVSQLLFVTGGVTDIGSIRNIKVRNGSNEHNFDLYKLLTEGDVSQDIRLKSGDVIFIPPIKKSAIIDGGVMRPGRYELHENDDISELIELAGGLSDRGYLKQVFVERYKTDEDLPVILNFDLSDNKNMGEVIFNGDIVRIASVNNRARNSITLKGAVQRPGIYGWFEGIKFTDLAKNLDIDFTENVDLNIALIMRRQDTNSNKIRPISFNLNEAISSPESSENLLLKPNDEILIFSSAHNDDSLNDFEFYIGDKEEIEILPNIPDNQTEREADADDSLDNNYDGKESLNLIDNITTDKLIDQRQKEIEFLKRNNAKRRILLEHYISKLSQQASSNEAVLVVSVNGAVKVPGDYPLTENLTYDDLILMAGGYSDDAFDKSAELRSIALNENGSVSTVLTELSKEELSNNFVASRDQLRVKRIKDWNVRDSITLKGEIFYPGEYQISPNETLSSVLKRAGGFTNESFIEGAIFTRESIKEKERAQLKILSDTIRRDAAARSMTKESEDFSVSSSELEAGITALMSSEIYGRLIIDLPRLINGDISADIVLQSGDVLEIPKYTNAVTVVGEVRRSGSFVMQETYRIEDYIELAAGMTARGNKKEIYLIRANGSVDKAGDNNVILNFSRASDDVQAGDTIVIPIKSSYQTPLNLYSTVSQVVFQSIASIAAFSTVFD